MSGVSGIGVQFFCTICQQKRPWWANVSVVKRVSHQLTSVGYLDGHKAVHVDVHIDGGS